MARKQDPGSAFPELSISQVVDLSFSVPVFFSVQFLGPEVQGVDEVLGCYSSLRTVL